jgi:hypothetical protein
MTFPPSHQPDSPHHFFTKLAGGWAGKTRTWFEPDSLADESPTQASIQLILDGRFAIYIYQSSLEDEPLHGMFTFGYNTTLNQYEASWVDSFHSNTAIMFCTGKATERGFSVLGSYPDFGDGPDWGWRTEVALRDPNHLTITAYNIAPEGQEFKSVETKLERIQ